MTSSTFPASTSTISAPPVYFRRGAGITTLSDMGYSFHEPLESVNLWVDHFGSSQVDRLRGLQAVARNGDNRDPASVDFALFDEFLGHGDTDTAGRFREYSFFFREKLDAGCDLWVGSVVCPAPGLENESSSVVSICGIADGEGLGDGVWLHRTNFRASPTDRVDDRVAAGSLRSEE